MSKLTERNLLKKSRFLKYSLLASISVGAVMTMPFEGMASSGSTGSLTDLSLDEHIKALKDDNFIKMQRGRSKSFSAGEGKKKRPLIRSKNTPEPIEQANTAIKPKSPPKPSGLKLVSAMPQKEAQVTKTPIVRPFLNQQKQLDVFTQQQGTNGSGQANLTKNQELINKNNQTKLDLNKLTQQQRANGSGQANLTKNQELINKNNQTKLDLNKLTQQQRTNGSRQANFTKNQELINKNNQIKLDLNKLTQQQRINGSRQANFTKNQETANEVRTDSANNKKLINKNNRTQLDLNRQHVATESQKKEERSSEDARIKQAHIEVQNASTIVKQEAKKAHSSLNNALKTGTKINDVQAAKNLLVTAIGYEIEKRVKVVALLPDGKNKNHEQDKVNRVEETKAILSKNIQKESLDTLTKGIERIASPTEKVAATNKLQKIINQQKAQQDLEVAILKEISRNGAKDNKIKELDAERTNLSVKIQNTKSQISYPPEEEDGYLVPKQGQQQDYIKVLPDNIGASSGFNLSSTLGSENEIQQNVQAVPDTPVKQTKENKPKEIPTPANMNSLPKNLVVTPPINVGSLYNSPQAQQFREDHKNIIINAINSISSSGVPKESIDSTITNSLPYLDNDQYQEVVLRVDRVHDINTRSYLLSKLKQLGESEVRENTAVYDSLYNTVSPEELKKAEDLLDRSQDRLNLVDSTIQKGTQLPKSNNTSEQLPVRSAELDKRLDYLDLGSSTFDLSKLTPQDQSRKVENAEEFVEEQYATVLNKNLNDKEQLERLAQEALDLSVKQSQLKQVQAGTEEIVEPIRKDIKNLKNPITLEQIKAKLAIEQFLNEEQLEGFLELWCKNNDDPSLTDLMNQISKGDERIQKLKEEKKILEDKAIPNSSMNKSEFSSSGSSSVDDISSAAQSSKPLILSRSPSVSSLNSLSRYEAEDSRSTPDHLGSTRVNISDEDSSETKLALLRTLQMAVTVKRQELEQLPSTSSGANQNAQQIKELKEEEVTMHDAINACITDPSKLNDVSLEEINEALKKLSSGIPESIINVLESKAQKDPEDLASNGKSESTLPTEDKESEDKEVTDVSRELSLLPASSNDCALALSDCREKECLALGDGSEDEESYDSGFEDEEETIEQLSDSEENIPETAAIDTVIPIKQEAMEEIKKNIETTAPTLNQGHKIIKNISNIISTRLDPAEVMTTAIAAGDEEETRIKRGLWVRGMYGINNHGRVENINGYRGINKGATIGFDVEIDNNIVGIAYSNVHSVFKFKNSKNNDKEIIDSHVVSIYGQKELPKDFALQALVSASKNFIKDKTIYSYGDNKIRSNVKHRNHSYNAEALLNYNYLVKNNLVITPNIGLRYGKSRDGVYNETGINVQEIALTMKENNILSGIVGTKVKVPLKDALKFNNLGLTFQGAVEHSFKEKTQRINRVVKIFDTEFKQNYAIPKQPKTSYNLGTGIMGSIKNTTISLDYNYYLNKHYRSHQGSVKLKVNL